MKKILIVADDYTGALDTGIQFVSHGMRTQLMMDLEPDFSEYPQTEVFIVDAETRHKSAKEAYYIVYQLTQKAVQAGIEFLYKKTDSGLRGNIPDELMAMLDASGSDFLVFLPAYPDMNRIVKNGISYIDGILLEESIFGKDPFEPAKYSRIYDIFGKYRNLVREYHGPEELNIIPGEKQIGIFDASSNEDMKKTTQYLYKIGRAKVLAGCAGLASAFLECLDVPEKNVKINEISQPFLIVCGSINDISKKQVQYAKQSGASGITLSLEQQLSDDYMRQPEGDKLVSDILNICSKQGVCILDTISDEKYIGQYLKKAGLSMKDAGSRIADRIGEILQRVLSSNMNLALMIIGGDTLYHFINRVNCKQISLICELENGVVCSEMKLHSGNYKVISKSGGFGSVDLLVRLINMSQNCGNNQEG